MDLIKILTICGLIYLGASSISCIHHAPPSDEDKQRLVNMGILKSIRVSIDVYQSNGSKLPNKNTDLHDYFKDRTSGTLFEYSDGKKFLDAWGSPLLFETDGDEITRIRSLGPNKVIELNGGDDMVIEVHTQK
ncbi:MAG: hypothetical protein AAF797_13265 [Planctomycetota bacterium]